MACFHPLPAQRNPAGGKPIVFSRLNPPARIDLKLPCGKCIGCKISHGQNWAIRALHESQQHERNAFVTLTYDPNYLLRPTRRVLSTAKPVDKREDALDLPTITPEGLREPNIVRVDKSRSRPHSTPVSLEDHEHSTSCLVPEGGPGGNGSLSKNDHQKFLKRTRLKLGPLRYLMCGEYGEKFARPHYHYLLFGIQFEDRTYDHTSDSGEKLYRSATLEQLWPFGKAWIGDVTYESCAYVAAYVTKKITGPKADEHYRRTDEHGNDYWLTPEFSYMSRNPGLAKNWWLKFSPDVTTDDHVVKPNGARMRPPRYYDKLLELFDQPQSALQKFRREMRAKELQEDNTPARLEAKEAYTRAKYALKKRNLEST